MKIIGQSQHDTFIVEMSQDEWESLREGRNVMPFISELEFLRWAKAFKAEFNSLDISPYLRKRMNENIDFLCGVRDDPDNMYWEMVLADGNHLRSFVEWAFFMTTVPDALAGYRFWSMRKAARAELHAALEAYLQRRKASDTQILTGPLQGRHG